MGGAVARGNQFMMTLQTGVAYWLHDTCRAKRSGEGLHSPTPTAGKLLQIDIQCL